MSIWKDAADWPNTTKACGAPHQSPVNLSRSFALPCDRLCELQIDSVAISQASAQINSDTGAIELTFGSVKPTAKFNGEGYTCHKAFLFTPGQHTVENIRAEAEFIALFDNPKGYELAVSVPVRTSPGETPSTAFFNTFVPYPQEPDAPIQVSLGSSWQLQNIIPESKGFYVYEGAWITPGCQPNVTWVVFGSSVTIDPSDYARVARNEGGSRPLQPIGDRQVFFNDGEKVDRELSKEFQNHDGKTYMRCRRIPREGETVGGPGPKTSGLGDKAAQAASETQQRSINNLQAQLGDAYSSIGGAWGLLVILVLLILTGLLFSEKGAPLMKGLFGFLLFIPNYLHTLFTNRLPASSP